jgi:hypothetical protein
VELRQSIAVDPLKVAARLDSLGAGAAARDSLEDGIAAELLAEEFARRQRAFLDTMMVRLHYTVIDSTVEIFRRRIQAWTDGGVTGTEANEGGFGFTAAELDLAVFIYDGGRFTIGDYARYLAGAEPLRVSARADRGRIEQDLTLYFHHHAYADVARARPDLDHEAVAREVRQLKERTLIERIYAADVKLPVAPEAEELKAHHAAHRERFDGAPFAGVEERVREDHVAEREEGRYRALIARLKERTPVVVHEERLMRLEL